MKTGHQRSPHKKLACRLLIQQPRNPTGAATENNWGQVSSARTPTALLALGPLRAFTTVHFKHEKEEENKEKQQKPVFAGALGLVGELEQETCSRTAAALSRPAL
ncbi:hypothetical protein NDU88_002250 [Pleurodeles waltl]|uniref:Uncharacterized protein n=1 Tax=Pleurodeles waltl TaxID=8319 RepID=A0AAV7Q9B8_PLEWA|nr:hypothetical protein NDU88_002250 [Pleurodeles waltl]